MAIIALVGQKGGVGKSTVAMAVGAELHARGRKVLLVDADPQGTARVWAEVAAEQGHEVPTVVGGGADMARPGQVPTLAKSFDDVVIDCPGRRGDVQGAALRLADLALVPCGPSAADTWALAETLEQIATAQSQRTDLKAAVLITRKVSRTALGKGARDSLATCGLPVLETELGFRVAYQEAPAAGLGVAQYAPTDPAADEVRALVDELMAVAGVSQAKGGRKHG